MERDTTRGRARRAIGMAALLLPLLAGCSGGSATTGQPAAAVAVKVVAAGSGASLIIAPGTLRLVPGQVQDLLVVGTDAGGGAVTSPKVDDWTVEPAGIVTIDAAGRLTAVREGRAQIRARAGTLTSAPLEAIVLRIVSIAITPAAATLNVRDDVPGAGPDPGLPSVQLQATVLLSDGSPGGDVAWSTGDPARVTVSGGKVTVAAGAAPGPVTVSAHSLWAQDPEGQATITLTADGSTRVVLQ